MFAYSNPYYDLDLVQFIVKLLTRVTAFLTGQSLTLASDELQMLVLSSISASAALVGSFLMLRKMTMLANSLSHTILVGIFFAYLAHIFLIADTQAISISLTPSQWLLLPAAFFMALLTTFLTQLLQSHFRVQEDASIGIVFTTLFAIGITLITVVSHNAHIGVEMVMGNVDALSWGDLNLSLVALITNFLFIYVFYRPLVMTTFDSVFAYSLGFSNTLYSYLIMSLASLTIIGAFRAVGMLMVLSFLVGLPLIARMWTNRLTTMIGISALIGLGLSIFGVGLARHILTVYEIALSTSGLIVCLIALCYFVSLLLAPEKGLAILWWHKRNQRLLQKHF